MGKRLGFSTVLVAMGWAATASAADDRPITGYIEVSPDMAVEHATSNVIYINGCHQQGDCQIQRGPEDARNNRSSIIRSSSVNIPPFPGSEAQWNALMACIKDMYAPFNVVITDERPASGNYFMAIAAGDPSDIGMSPYVGGVAPFSCGVIENAITYSFAEVYGGAMQQLCEVVAQESAHAFGLDHELHCPDPMTYLSGCGAKKFRDFDAQCGEDRVRACQCGGSTQNSYQRILAEFGPAVPTPPSVEITSPRNNDTVQPGFVVRADITDDLEVDRASLFIDGSQIIEIQSPPFVFNAPMTLGEGTHEVRVCASDPQDAEGCDSINVVLGEPCTSDDACPGANVCVEGRCVPGPQDPGGLGSECETSDDCVSGLCASDGLGNKFCTEFCEMSCPSGFDCLNAGDDNVCAPGADEPGGGCSSTTGVGNAASGLFFALLGLLVLGRRRRA